MNSLSYIIVLVISCTCSLSENKISKDGAVAIEASLRQLGGDGYVIVVVNLD